MKRFWIVLLVLAVALSGILPAALFAAHRGEACAGRGHCRTCRILEAALLLLRLLLLLPLLAALLGGRLFSRVRIALRSENLFSLSPVARKVRLND